ncbi:solute carrier family 22 member 3-like [Amphiura filiformis]|uniref:solute carrier family 22 member 3-like n=1 Tax=Amphiura filiformis TaxID=82378 RepID=UPI003B20E52D
MLNRETIEVSVGLISDEATGCGGENEDKTMELSRSSLLNVIKTPILLRILLINLFCWFTNGIIYYGLSLNSITLSGNKYLNVFLTCMIELPSAIIMVLALMWIGRRTALSGSFFGLGVCCVVLACLPQTSSKFQTQQVPL